MKRRPRFVYLAAPYSSDPNANTRVALRHADELIRNGFSPFVPHLCHFWDMLHPGDYDHWFDYVSSWIDRVDALVVVPGGSPGVVREIEIAKEKGVPVYTREEFLLEFRG